ncbi:PREDICTED: uncharacterized protein LOC109153494 [Ipomoea nil]|uniref:uncharacterized protein LOC109153494 n=1 Tax=Ipomoea nil TaxID=35883 RepID=UPI000900EFA8|nr:PREDICTED: uncharacterized protein LOC109153494 [Ipomoea nil]
MRNESGGSHNFKKPRLDLGAKTAPSPPQGSTRVEPGDQVKRYRSSEEAKIHLIRRGFKEWYDQWIWHGESLPHSTSVSKNEAHADSQTHAKSETEANSRTQADNEENDEDDGIKDRIDEMMRDMQGDCSEMPLEFKCLFENAEKPLFSGCAKYTKLSGVLKLYNLKANNGWSDKSFTGLLELIKDMLPNDNELPNSTYEAKKLLSPLEYKDLHVCPKCGSSRYKRKNVGDEPKNKKGPPAKVLWYLPVIPRFKRMFANPRDAKNLQWHAIGRKDDGKLRHPADSPQWRNIDRRCPKFGTENRSLRLGLCTDGMNPHGNDIDVYLAPLIEDLKLLWNEGVSVYDAYTRESITLRAMIFCTINDFPAYGNLSGYTNKGAKACPICEDETVNLWLNNSKKNVFMSHRTFLPIDHPYRKKKKAFNGESETGVARLSLSGLVVYDCVKNVNVAFSKTCKTTQKTLWKKRSIFWDLPYWKHLAVRHCLDVMHIEKNVCDIIIGTLLNIQGKTKDGIKARKDMVVMGIREKLAPQEMGKRAYLPPACHTLSKKEKTSFCACLNGVKVPSGYSSNIKKLVSMKDLKLVGMKSHDCHVLMQQMLHIAIRDFYPNMLGKVVDADVLDALQAEVVVTLCQLEMYFPPSFFDIMVHLIVHLVREIKMTGPVFMRYMYPFERYMGILKGYLRNRYRPEGSIIEGYGSEEAVEFCTDYLANVESIGNPKPIHEGRLSGKGTIGFKHFVPPTNLRDKAHHLVLEHLTEVHPYLEQHMSMIRQQNPSKGYDINGYTFYTKRQDEKSVVQNSGVTLVATSKDYSSAKDTKPIDVVMPYYGVIEEIWEIDYNVFYVSDPVDKKWSIVLQGKRSIVGVGDVVDEEEYDHFDETPPFSIGIQSLSSEDNNLEISYMRSDHEEDCGLTIGHHSVLL